MISGILPSRRSIVLSFISCSAFSISFFGFEMNVTLSACLIISFLCAVPYMYIWAFEFFNALPMFACTFFASFPSSIKGTMIIRLSFLLLCLRWLIAFIAPCSFAEWLSSMIVAPSGLVAISMVLG